MRSVASRAAWFCVFAALTGALAGCPRGEGDVVLLVNPTSLDFGVSANSLTFTVSRTATTGNPVSFQVTNLPAWLTADPPTGATTGPSDRRTIALTIDRSLMPVGENTATVIVEATGVVPVEVTVRGVAPLVADFQASTTVPFVDDPVQFTDRSEFIPSEEEIVSWLWDFGDGATSSQQNPVHSYSAPGSYDVSLTVETTAGTVSTRARAGFITVEPREAPVASFDVSTLTPSAGQSVQFTDTSDAGTVPITSWEWDFGDGETSTTRNPLHAYEFSGQYTVTLTVTTDHGSDSASQVIDVQPVPPTANFEASPTSIREGNPVQFTDLSIPGSAPIESWSWDFGDGGASTEQNPEHVYTDAGLYSVTLNVTTPDGTDSRTRPNYIEVIEPTGPTAQFTVDNQTPVVNTEIQFTDQSIAGTSPITEWLWDFGDGTSSAEQHPAKTYTDVGIFTVSLMVTTEDGEDTEIKADYINVAPVLDFTSDKVNVVVGEAVTFTDISQVEPLEVTEYLWEFGDGLTSASASPQHLYGNQGTYSVTMHITLSNGQTFSVTKDDLITVELAGPTANFTVSSTRPTRFERVDFFDLSEPGSAPIIEWSWGHAFRPVGSPDEFGDPQEFSTAQQPSFTYEERTEVEVTLTVTTPVGEDSASMVLVIDPDRPVAAFVQNKKVVYREATNLRLDSRSYVLGNSSITGYSWWGWKGDPGYIDSLSLEEQGDRSNAGGAVWNSTNKNSYFDYPWRESGMYHLRHQVSAGVLSDPGDVEDPEDPALFEADSTVKAEAVEVREPSPLDLYAHVPDRNDDPDYEWSVEQTVHDTFNGDGYTVYKVRMQSQRWPFGQPAEWQHWVTVILPDQMDHEVAFLYLDSGERDDPMPNSIDERLLDIALSTNSVVVILEQTLSQPLFVPMANATLSGHELVGTSMTMFYNTVEPRTFALFPMVKAAVRAMDTTQKLLVTPTASGLFPPVIVEEFVVAGGDLEAWATWLTATADPRVIGIIPVGWSNLEFRDQVVLQLLSALESGNPVPTEWEPYIPGLDGMTGSVANALRVRAAYLRLSRAHLLALEPQVLRDEDDNWAQMQQLLDRLGVGTLEEDEDTGDPFIELEDFPANAAGFQVLPTLSAVGQVAQTLLAEAEQLWMDIADELAAAEDERGAVGQYIGNLFSVYGGRVGGLRSRMVELEETLLNANRGRWLEFMADPIFFNSPWVPILNFESPYGARLPMRKHLVLATGDEYFHPEGASLYYGRLAGVSSLRFLPNTDHSLTAEGEDFDGYLQAVYDSLPVYIGILNGFESPAIETDHLDVGMMRIRAINGTPSQVNLWTAQTNQTDFRIDEAVNPNPPEWVRTEVGFSQNMLIQVRRQLEVNTAYFVEMIFPFGAGRQYVVTTPIEVVPPYEPIFKDDEAEQDGSSGADAP